MDAGSRSLATFPWELTPHLCTAKSRDAMNSDSSRRPADHATHKLFVQVIQAFVRQAMGYVEQTPDKDTKVSLIKTLQTVTEGKVGRAEGLKL
jgi:hypothetical protein